ncbi:Hypothetical predicted protein [Mytilus galloprovincialis]|uniref:Uncharacterized protein n=1 Tax=Mytilus galloprovincialis TaxID=29158 RepID=A0A8B6CT12_MYTGA|nr:Hypothetical predicted protein [Mytilus galloprovincialis]
MKRVVWMLRKDRIDIEQHIFGRNDLLLEEIRKDCDESDVNQDELPVYEISDRVCGKDIEIARLSDLADIDDVEDVDDQPAAKTKSVRWQKNEIIETEEYFSENLRTKTCPSKKEVMKAINTSKKKKRTLAHYHKKNLKIFWCC